MKVKKLIEELKKLDENTEVGKLHRATSDNPDVVYPIKYVSINSKLVHDHKDWNKKILKTWVEIS